LIENKLTTIQNLKNAKENIEKQAAAELIKLVGHRKILTDRRKLFINSILQNNSFIKIDIDECADSRSLEKSFRTLLNRDEGFQDDILSDDQQNGLLSDLNKSFDYTKLQNLKNVIKKIKSDKSDDTFLKKKIIVYDKRFLSYVQKSVTDEMIDSIDLWFPEDKLTVSYNRDSGKSKFVSIEQGSPGQKTAAILAFLLSYGKEPIILDQPEDDLDNHLIFDLVVKQVRENKKRRQIIIVTHNPNIVVNGDAEMVHTLAFVNGQIEDIQKGCLQEKNIRLEICQVMEGGRLAFEQRFRRINIGELYV
jgi:predicted ATPase